MIEPSEVALEEQGVAGPLLGTAERDTIKRVWRECGRIGAAGGRFR